jgi:hypothetical protein
MLVPLEGPVVPHGPVHALQSDDAHSIREALGPLFAA